MIMFVRDHSQPELYQGLGMDPDGFDHPVFEVCSEITRQVFPLTLDFDHSDFRKGLERLSRIGKAIETARTRGGLAGSLEHARLVLATAAAFARLSLIPRERNAVPGRVRLAPVW